MYLGIDLGTTNSAIVGISESELKVFKTTDGADTLPSVIYVDKRGHRLYGRRAYDQTLLSPENVAAGFKRLMGTSTIINLKDANLDMKPEECSAEILKILMSQAFLELGKDEIIGVVITIPAAFNQMQTEATIRAAELAGIPQVALLQEPIAAAMSAMSQSKNKSGQFLVYDLGGGTFDLALVQSISGNVNIIDHEGINMLGGRDFDRYIVNQHVRPWLLSMFDLPEDFQKLPKYKKIVGIARLAAEKAKIELSTSESEMIFASDEEIRLKDNNGKDIYLEIKFTRQDLENLVSEDIQQTILMTNNILKNNGYTNEDIDRIVFIGGPTKMPFIRKMVPQELGIPLDLQIDPMTAVALGAAIYAESREWNGQETKRKAVRSTNNIHEGIDLRYDYPSRTSDEIAKVRIKIGEQSINNGIEIQIDSSTGWTSGRKSISGDCIIDILLSEMGDNSFKIIAFDNDGKPLKDASKTFTITRTRASSAGIPATQTIAVKIRETADSTRNILFPVIKKGTMLPTKGEHRFRAAKDLRSSDSEEFIEFELFQDEGARLIEHNQYIGSFRISGDDLESGMKIREGDEIVFNWNMSDSGLLKCTFNLPSIGQTFESHNYYVDQAGHQAFHSKEGAMIAIEVLDLAENELDELIDMIGQNDTNDLLSIQREMEKQKETLENDSEPDTARSVTESGRRIRQAISNIKYAPENRSMVLSRELKELISIYEEHARGYVDEKTQEIFDINARNASECLDRGDEKDIRDAESHIAAIRTFLFKGLFNNPEYIIETFREAAAATHLATDKIKYDELVQKGIDAIKTNDIDELRRIIIQLYDLQIRVGRANTTLDKLASIMRA